MGTTATVVYKRLASMISEKYEKPYSKTMRWIRCRLNFLLLHSAIMCLRGYRSSRHHQITTPSVEALLTLPAHWAGSQTMTELLIIPFTLESFFLFFTFVSIFNNFYYVKKSTSSCSSGKKIIYIDFNVTMRATYIGKI